MESIHEHVERMVGTPWMQASDDPENGGVDCWGSNDYAWLCVKGVHLPPPPWRVDCETDKAAKAAIASGAYLPTSTPETMDLFTCHDDNGVTTHCGLVVDGMAYHAAGSVHQPGRVCLWDMKTLQRVYGEVRFYRVNKDKLEKPSA